VNINLTHTTLGKELRAMGISPNIIIARADEPLDDGIKERYPCSAM
jgi:CTP synthase (UTP-ammonia lyase)